MSEPEDVGNDEGISSREDDQGYTGTSFHREPVERFDERRWHEAIRHGDDELDTQFRNDG